MSTCSIQTQVLKGKILQPLRSHSNNANSNFNANNTNSQEQVDDAYYGKILLINDNKKEGENQPKKVIYQFGMFSLSDKRNYFQNGDLVTFQLIESGNKKFAYNINYTQSPQEQQQMQQQQQQTRTRGNTTSLSSNNYNGDFKRGKVDSVKGHCGHIEYVIGNNGEMKKLFFHISDVQSDGNEMTSAALKSGDEVEFMVSHNPRNNKYSATKIKRISSKDPSSSSNKENGSTTINNDIDNKRPERLITKLKLANIDKSGKQLVLTRQPNNPDMGKTKSFNRQLNMRLPGSLTPLVDQQTTTTSTTTSSSSTTGSNQISIDDIKSNTDNTNTNTNDSQARLNSMSIMELLMGAHN